MAFKVFALLVSILVVVIGFVVSQKTIDSKAYSIAQNTYKELTDKANGLINDEYKAMYYYDFMAASLNHVMTAKKGFAKYFRKMSDKAMTNARKLSDYLNMRGLTVEFSPIERNGKDTWKTGQAALQDAIENEMQLNKKYIELAKAANDLLTPDPHLMYFVQKEMLQSKLERIEQLRVLLSRVELLARSNEKSAEFFVDQELREEK